MKSFARKKMGKLGAILLSGALVAGSLIGATARTAVYAESETTTITYEASDLTFADYWNESSTFEDGELSFSSQYNTLWAQLPDEVDMSKCTKVSIAVNNQGGKVAFQLFNSGNKDFWIDYNGSGQTTYEYDMSDVTDTAIAFGMMSLDEADEVEYPFTLQFVSITFTVEDTADAYYAITYEASDLTFADYWNESSTFEDAELSFSSQYNTLWAQLPDEVDMSKCTKVSITVSDQGGKVAFQLFGSDNNDFWIDYTGSGQTTYEYDMSDVTDTAIAFGMMSLDAANEVEYPFTLQFVSITFTMENTCGTEFLGGSLRYGWY